MRAKGNKGEKKAVKFLRKKGYQILSTNFQCRLGEIDIIAKENDVIVFVEVKLRENFSFGTANEAISPQKISKLILTAKYWIAQEGVEVPCRFDVISINNNEIEQIENAFTL